MLSAYPEIDGVWSQGGAMTQGAIDAFIAAGRDLVPMTSEGNNGAIRAWIENKDKGLSCIAPSNPTYTSAEALRVVIKALTARIFQGTWSWILRLLQKKMWTSITVQICRTASGFLQSWMTRLFRSFTSSQHALGMMDRPMNIGLFCT